MKIYLYFCLHYFHNLINILRVTFCTLKLSFTVWIRHVSFVRAEAKTQFPSLIPVLIPIAPPPYKNGYCE